MEKSKSYGVNFIGMDDFIEKMDKINNEYGKKIDTLLSKAGDIAIAQSLMGRKKLVEETSSAAACGRILRESIGKSMYPFKDPKELRIDLPEDFAKKHVSDTRCIIPGQEHYAISVLESLIQRIRNRSIFITCLSISEEDFSTLSINWRSKNETK